ncbi:MAG TPA: hypothetical protein VNK41_05305 [Vicinamibacterales bacterium]|nr:hypothetical protein [Vicinamibacterales bacterium]
MRFTLQRIRRWRAPAVLVLAAMCAGPLGVPHLDALGDAACAPPATAHDAAAHRFTASASADDGHHQHCFVCHWARSFSVLLRGTGHADTPAPAAERLHTAALEPHHQIAWALVPGRAPPSVRQG